MDKIFIYVLMIYILVVYGCEPNTSNTLKDRYGEITIKVTDSKIADKTLVITYTITNTSNHYIWLCDGINQLGKGDITAEGKQLIIRMLSSLPYPDDTLLYLPPIAYYSKLQANKTIKRTFNITLPISDLSPLFYINNFNTSSTKMNQILFQVGFFNERQVNELGPYAKIISENQLQVAVLRESMDFVKDNIVETIINDIEIFILPERK